jgi:hypothetical protein
MEDHLPEILASVKDLFFAISGVSGISALLAVVQPKFANLIIGRHFERYKSSLQRETERLKLILSMESEEHKLLLQKERDKVLEQFKFQLMQAAQARVQEHKDLMCNIAIADEILLSLSKCSDPYCIYQVANQFLNQFSLTPIFVSCVSQIEEAIEAKTIYDDPNFKDKVVHMFREKRQEMYNKLSTLPSND